MTVLRSLPLNVRTLFLYAQDTHGLGHVTRTLTIARHVLARYPNAVAYVATASPVAGQHALPPRCDYIKLPTLLTPDGVRLAPPQEEEVKRHFRRIRGAILRDAVLGLEPDVVLVDHEPLGAKGEFADGLAALKGQRERRLSGARGRRGGRDAAPGAAARAAGDRGDGTVHAGPAAGGARGARDGHVPGGHAGRESPVVRGGRRGREYGRLQQRLRGAGGGAPARRCAARHGQGRAGDTRQAAGAARAGAVRAPTGAECGAAGGRPRMGVEL